MTINRKNSGRASSIPAGLALGTAVAMGITILGAVLLGRMVASETMLWENVGYGIMGILFVSSYFGTYISCGRTKRMRLIVTVATGGLYFTVLLMITALFFGGQYEAVGITAAMILAGCGTFFLIGNSAGRGGKGKRSKKRYG